MEHSDGRTPQASGAAYPFEEKGLVAAVVNRTLGRRRRLLVNRAYQLRTAMIGVLGMGFLVVLMIVILDWINVQSSRELVEMAPFLEEGLRSRDRSLLLMMIGGGILFMAGVFVLGLLESHKTAGVVHNLKRRLEELRSGRLAARLTLRKHDHFPELATAFNDTVSSLRIREEGEIATLSRLIAQASDLLREESARNHAGARLAVESLRRSLEDLRRRKADLLEP